MATHQCWLKVMWIRCLEINWLEWRKCQIEDGNGLKWQFSLISGEKNSRKTRPICVDLETGCSHQGMLRLKVCTNVWWCHFSTASYRLGLEWFWRFRNLLSTCLIKYISYLCSSPTWVSGRCQLREPSIKRWWLLPSAMSPGCCIWKVEQSTKTH